MRHPGIVHEDIDMAESVRRGLRHGLNSVQPRDVDAHRHGMGAKIVRKRIGRLGVEVGDQDAGAFGDELADDPGAETRGAPRYDRGFTLKTCHAADPGYRRESWVETHQTVPLGSLTPPRRLPSPSSVSSWMITPPAATALAKVASTSGT